MDASALAPLLVWLAGGRAIDLDLIRRQCRDGDLTKVEQLAPAADHVLKRFEGLPWQEDALGLLGDLNAGRRATHVLSGGLAAIEHIAVNDLQQALEHL